MKKMALHLAAIGLLAAGSASAADLRMPVKAPAPAPVAAAYNWTGCYVGAGWGYGMFNQDTTTFTDPAGVQNSSKLTMGGRGWFGTVQVGCDYQVAQSFVIGAFGDYDFAGNIKGDFTVPNQALQGREKMSSSWAAGGRIGYLPFDRLLVYVSGGWTQARFNEIDFFSTGVAAAPQNVHIGKHTYDGWFIGSGYEYNLAFFPGLTWKTEYRYADFGTDRLVVLQNTGASSGFAVESHKFVQTVRSDLVWRFNFGGGPVVARY